MGVSKQQIIDEYTKLGELIAEEHALGEQLIQLTISQRKAHQAVLAQQDKVRHIND